jgi:surfactin synthase thioesterase subunit
MRYRPAAWPGEVTIVASNESLRLGVCRAWRARATGGVAFHSVPGDHESYFKRHYQESAEVLRVCLRDHVRRRGLA